MPKLDSLAPIIWAKWGGTFLEALRQEALDAADGLAFRAMNSGAGVRTLLIVCTTDRARVRAIEEAGGSGMSARSADWKGYSVAEMVFKTEKCGGQGQVEFRDRGEPIALILCATRPSAVRALEEMFDLPA